MKFILLLVLASCMSSDINSPEGALKNFVESRIGNVVTRQFVLDHVTGKMKQSFEVMSDDDFSKFADLRKVHKDSFKILSKSCQDKKCYLTYSIKYISEGEISKSTSSEVKKIAEVVQEDGKWLIAEVTNVKTYHEALDPINPLE
jgi:hypothetical protein